MEQLDLVDKKIINALNQDARINYSEIAKKIHTSKEVVNYRIKRLQEKKIITEFVTIFGFGYQAYKILVDFSKIDFEKEKEIITYLKTNPNINWITTCTGGWDLVFSIMAKDAEQFDKIFREVLAKMGTYINNYSVGISIGSQTFGHTYILGALKEPEQIKRNTNTTINFDDKDKEIAKILHHDARAKLIDIAIKTNIPVDTIKYRIKKMRENSVIRRFRLILDPSKLGYHRYEVFIKCVNLSDRIVSKFREYAKQNANIEYFSKCVGGWDIEFTLHFKTQDELRKFIIDVKTEFGEYIKKFETITLFETYNYVYFPQELM